MKVAFLHARQDPKYAEIMVREVMRAMPHAGLYQLTDSETPLVQYCFVKRLEWTHTNPMIFKMEHLSRLEGEWLILDTDVVVQHDLSGVFSLPFDMALTWRDGPIYDPSGVDITKQMPINCGVMFQRNNKFWIECLKWCSGRDVGWYADQLAVAAVHSKFDTLRLHCDNFNYTPRSATEDVSRRLAVHYKGTKRKFMDARFGL